MNGVKITDIVDIKYLLEPDEYEAVMAIRKKKNAQKKIQEQKQYLFSATNKVIQEIGMEETKRIIRELNKRLRMDCGGSL